MIISYIEYLFLNKFFLSVPDEQIDLMLRAVNTNRDTKIDISEFGQVLGSEATLQEIIIVLVSPLVVVVVVLIF